MLVLCLNYSNTCFAYCTLFRTINWFQNLINLLCKSDMIHKFNVVLCSKLPKVASSFHLSKFHRSDLKLSCLWIACIQMLCKGKCTVSICLKYWCIVQYQRTESIFSLCTARKGSLTNKFLSFILHEITIWRKRIKKFWPGILPIDRSHSN
jgi:hypothetical protein